MKKISFFICFLLMFSVIFSSSASANSEVNKAFKNSFGSSSTSFTLRDLQTGNVVYERAGNSPLSPASSLKTVTGAAALNILGNDYKFHTYLYYSGSIANGVLNGDVYIKGEGDPTLQVSDLTHFAGVLKRNGITKINGHLYGDDSWFSGSQLAPGVLKSYEGDYYAAPTSALVMSVDEDYDAGTVKVQVNPSKVGSSANVAILPNASGLRIINQAKTVAKGQGTSISVSRKTGTNQIVVSGRVAIGSSSTQIVSVYNSTLSTLHSFATVLKANGVQLSPSSKITYGTLPSNATKIQTKVSQPLQQLMKPYLKLSNNAIADILLKAMGQKVYGVGDLAHGLQAVQQYLDEMAIDTSKWSLVDGSGLAAGNKVTTNQLTQLLFNVKKTPYYNTFLNALPVGGQSSKFAGGSLKTRFTTLSMKNRIMAKTGYIPGAYSLSGYVRTNSGKWYAFSVLTSKSGANPSIDSFMQKIVTQY